MGDQTDIEWADATWNPLRGCSRASEGCRNCYAERMAGRFGGPGQPYEGVAIMKTTARGGRQGAWTGKVSFVPSVLKHPIKWKQPRLIFVNSMSDLFHEKAKTAWIDKIMAVMAMTPRHTYVTLTKRADRQRDYFNDPEMRARVRAELLSAHSSSPLFAVPDVAALLDGSHIISNGPPANVWAGVSVEDQTTADERIGYLRETRATKRLVSYEPALGPVDFNRFMVADGHDASALPLDWIICGGESGVGARPMHPDWARQVRDQCVAAGVPFFFKQWGAWANVGVANDRGTHHAWDDGTVMRLSGKRKAGHLLDGMEWLQMPILAHLTAAAAAEAA